jgi:uncharacterized protein (TIGR00251 family)
VTRPPWTAVDGGVVIDVRLTPRGGRDGIDGVEQLADGRAMLKARVRAAPTEGEANTALCRLIAKTLRTTPREVELVAGARSRVKRIRVAGEPTALMAMLIRSVG